VCAVAVTFLGVVSLTAATLGRPFSYFSREPASALGGAWYAGFVSNVGILLWAVGATASLLAWWIVRHQPGAGSNLLLWAGILTTGELLDDLFLLHDAVYPMLGVPEQAVVAVYGLATLTLAVVFRDRLGRTGIVAVGFSLALFTASFGFDQAWPGNHLLEDSLKFIGIATWTSYLVALSAAELRGASLPSLATTREPTRASAAPAE
jgi:hypothetical protein